MEHDLNPSALRLFELLESKNYEELDSDEQVFVHQHLSEAEYRLRRRIQTDSEQAFESDELPLPLIIPDSGRKKGITVPLYQAVLAVASVIIVFLLIWPDETKAGKEQTKVPVAPSTSIQFQTEYIHDTLIRYVTLIQEKLVTDTIYEWFNTTSSSVAETRMLQAGVNVALPEISKENIQNLGSSLKEDGSSQFIVPVINSSFR